MDGWMDGEVLIIGKVVGWSGWVPKGLPSFNSRYGPRPFFWSFFLDTIFFVFFRCWVDFKEFWEAKMEAKIDFRDVFFLCFFRTRSGIDFGWIFGASEPEKSTKTIVFSMVFLNFQ